MPVAIATKKHIKTPTKRPFQPHTVPLGNGVDFPVNDEETLSFVEWAIAESKAGRMSLPTRVGPNSRPHWLDEEPEMSHEEFMKLYEDR